MALKSAHSRSQFVNTTKQILSTARDLVGLSWVKAHVGIPGNEWADQHAKLAISVGEELEIPAPRSYLNRKIKSYILHNWLTYWNNYNSASGIRASPSRQLDSSISDSSPLIPLFAHLGGVPWPVVA
ncbi:hypothetical protein AVEN_274926-1 [Araneus ventricosus]|uniref:RNase H type-1 domain-containing protein n=1 Tax=Araneus ventricosus TaxID=182803 RepID=A0A4Y2I4P3_ARAVE|nr:hypothetical protein AVEN_274926-1 [Araneus ventricosus]